MLRAPHVLQGYYKPYALDIGVQHIVSESELYRISAQAFSVNYCTVTSQWNISKYEELLTSVKQRLQTLFQKKKLVRYICSLLQNNADDKIDHERNVLTQFNTAELTALLQHKVTVAWFLASSMVPDQSQRTKRHMALWEMKSHFDISFQTVCNMAKK